VQRVRVDVLLEVPAGVGKLRRNGAHRAPWASPLWPVKLSVPLAAFLMFLQGLAQYIRTLTLAFTGKELS